MRRAVLFLAVCLSSGATQVNATDYFQQFVHYTIHAGLDSERKWISGSESIMYVNNSPDTLREFYLHLYANAFRNKDVPYQRDQHRVYNVTLRDIPDDRRGWIDMSNVRVDTDSVTVTVDGTIAHMRLPHALAPGDSMTIALDFESKVRKSADRMGYRGNHFDVAQWYPKVVVYDRTGFHPDQFETGEFYGEFGTFDVHIEVPDNFVVVATGVVQSGDPGWDYNPAHQPDAPQRKSTGSTRTLHFHAERVHDFAWCADPSYVVQDTTLDGIHIRSVYRRSSAGTWEDSTLAHAVRAIQFLGRKVGHYPYPHITVAEGLRSGGMEYPMFVMDGRADESLVMHEIAHVYFYGILANNEREEAWLDEGFASFMADWHKVEEYGPWGDTSRWNWYQRMTPQHPVWEAHRRRVFDLERRNYGERVSFRSENYDHSYRVSVYDKANLTINALRFVVGDSLFTEILHEYFNQWQFKHVTEESFRGVCENLSKRDLSRQFGQWLHTTKKVDYQLDKIGSRPDSAGVTTEVLIRRPGELYCPIDVCYTLPDGSQRTQRVDARDRTIRAQMHLPAKPVRVAINPDNEIIDRDLSDNVLPRKTDFQIDWPNNGYFPEDAYLIRYRPAVWYNDVDGAKVGLHLYGSLHDWQRRLRLGLYYGAESGQLDFSASAEFPKRMLNANAVFRLAGYRMEGRNDASISFQFVKRTKLMEPPTHRFVIGYGYHELRDPAYLPSPEMYDTLQADTGPFFAYSIDPQLDIASTNVAARLTLGRDWFGGDTDFERLALTATLHSRPANFWGLDTRLRLFGGFAGGALPTQRKFNLAGAGPMQTDQRFWLRSPGAVPSDLNYVEPGDGNMRGYFPGTFGVNKLVSFNSELGTRVRLLGLEKPLAKLVGSLSWYGFYDAGWILDSSNPILSSARVQSLVDGGVLNASLQDAGVGVRGHVAWPFWNFTWRLDVPLWVSYPALNGETDQTDFRYLFSLNAAF